MGSTQGYYVLASDGTPIGVNNYLPKLEGFLDDAHARALRTKKSPPAPKKEDLQRAEALPLPEGASVIRLFTKIRPLPPSATEINSMLGRDYMWILAGEVEAIASSASEVGKKFELPQAMSRRLCSFHLVDNVRGQVWPWQRGAVKSCAISARVVAVEKNIRKLVLEGQYALGDSNPPHWQSRGQEGALRGELDVDASTKQVLRLRAIVQATAWSDAKGPFPPPPGKYPLQIALVEARDAMAKKINPEVAQLGRRYLDP